jgi:dCMP deaminase
MRADKYDHVHLATAELYAAESHCPRTKVGCVVVTETGAVFPGLNGMPPGGPNDWEFSETGNPEVLHAELQALGKMLEQGVSAAGSTVYVTLSPCLECSKLLVRAKIFRVVYKDKYRKTEGLDYLKKYGVIVEQKT